jgi:hypothetical protein
LIELNIKAFIKQNEDLMIKIPKKFQKRAFSFQDPLGMFPFFLFILPKSDDLDFIYSFVRLFSTQNKKIINPSDFRPFHIFNYSLMFYPPFRRCPLKISEILILVRSAPFLLNHFYLSLDDPGSIINYEHSTSFSLLKSFPFTVPVGFRVFSNLFHPSLSRLAHVSVVHLSFFFRMLKGTMSETKTMDEERIIMNRIKAFIEEKEEVEELIMIFDR